ncbi:Uncharacterised protein [Bordetella pertussis]|nr:Uncharacterised protein [Bordetella pertussis]
MSAPTSAPTNGATDACLPSRLNCTGTVSVLLRYTPLSPLCDVLRLYPRTVYSSPTVIW